jgi:hypothetical protein
MNLPRVGRCAPFLAITLTALALAAQDQQRFKDLLPPAPREDGMTARLDGLEKHACAKCHADVFAEWSSSLHALAWVSEPYQAEVEGKSKPQGCWGCHIPTRLMDTDLAQKPAAREQDQHFGVDCIACHQDSAGVVHGPWGAETDAHTSARDARFVGAGSNAVCATCHRTNIGPVIGIAKDFDESGAACVDCHMAEVERTLADGVQKRAGRSHALQTPRDPSFLARAFALRLVRREAQVFAQIENTAGHRLPGLIDRSFEFELSSFDAAEQPLGVSSARISTRSSLDAKALLEIELPALTTQLRVSARHIDPRQEEPLVFLQLELR